MLTVIEMARAFTLECLKIMSMVGANLDYIDPSIFYYRRIGQLVENSISGADMMTPKEMCDDALRTIRQEFLGLAHPGGRIQEIISNHRREIRYSEWKPKSESN